MAKTKLGVVALVLLFGLGACGFVRCSPPPDPAAAIEKAKKAVTDAGFVDTARLGNPLPDKTAHPTTVGVQARVPDVPKNCLVSIVVTLDGTAEDKVTDLSLKPMDEKPLERKGGLLVGKSRVVAANAQGLVRDKKLCA